MAATAMNDLRDMCRTLAEEVNQLCEQRVERNARIRALEVALGLIAANRVPGRDHGGAEIEVPQPVREYARDVLDDPEWPV